jgi:hypothetical protein
MSATRRKAPLLFVSFVVKTREGKRSFVRELAPV